MSEGEKQVKKGGRPRLYPGTERRPTLTIRIRDRMHAQLTEAATANQRSLSEEIERRVDESFTVPDMARKAADTAAKAVLSNNFGSREIFEAAQLYGGILRGLIDRLRLKAVDEQDWDELDGAKEYLKRELAARVDGMVEALFCDLDLKRLQGADAYEADALVGERRIPREIAATYLVLQVKRGGIRQQLLPHLMDEAAQDDTEEDK